MNRIPVMVYPEGERTYWLCRSTGRVWNHPTEGTAWKEPAVNYGHNRWSYRGLHTDLELREIQLQPDCTGTVSPAVNPAPLGLRPAFAAVAAYDKARCKEIGEAILRYAEAMQPVPQEWLDELSELTERNQPDNQHNTETLQ